LRLRKNDVPIRPYSQHVVGLYLPALGMKEKSEIGLFLCNCFFVVALNGVGPPKTMNGNTTPSFPMRPGKFLWESESSMQTKAFLRKSEKLLHVSRNDLPFLPNPKPPKMKSFELDSWHCGNFGSDPKKKLAP